MDKYVLEHAIQLFTKKRKKTKLIRTEINPTEPGKQQNSSVLL